MIIGPDGELPRPPALPWLEFLRAYDGLAEIPGKDTCPQIRQWLIQMRAWWTDDETPWCGVAVDAAMRAAGFEPPRESYRAASWATWGQYISEPLFGCIVVFERKGGHHVGLVEGGDELGRLWVRGGNQKNRIGLDPFDRSRAKAFGWPPGDPLLYPWLPRLSSAGVLVSTNES